MLHEQLIASSGGSPGLRDDGMLESALAAPFQEFGNVAAYPTIYQKAARLGFGLIMNHPFVDGNKRIGAHVMLVFLTLNGINLNYSQKEFSDIILSVAASQIGYEELLQWIIEHLD